MRDSSRKAIIREWGREVYRDFIHARRTRALFPWCGRLLPRLFAPSILRATYVLKSDRVFGNAIQLCVSSDLQRCAMHFLCSRIALKLKKSMDRKILVLWLARTSKEFTKFYWFRSLVNWVSWFLQILTISYKVSVILDYTNKKKRIMSNTFTNTSPAENPSSIAFQECFPVFHEHRSVEWSVSFLDDPIYFFESSSYNGALIEASNWKTFLQLAIMLSSLIACPCFLVKMLLRVKRSRLHFLIVSSNKRESAWNRECLRRAFWE